MCGFDAIIFDFDGVLLESEFEGNSHLAELLTDLGHRTTRRGGAQPFCRPQRADFIAAIEARIGSRAPENSMSAAGAERHGAREGRACGRRRRRFRPVAPDRPADRGRIVQLDQLALRRICTSRPGEAFGEHVYSGGSMPIAEARARYPFPRGRRSSARHRRAVIIEDSDVGVDRRAGFGCDCDRPCGGIALPRRAMDRLRALGVGEIANSFDEVRELLGLA